MNEIIKQECEHSINGVPGRLFNVVADRSCDRIINQKWGSHPKRIKWLHQLQNLLKFKSP